jgi:hypothetical protein
VASGQGLVAREEKSPSASLATSHWLGGRYWHGPPGTGYTPAKMSEVTRILSAIEEDDPHAAELVSKYLCGRDQLQTSSSFLDARGNAMDRSFMPTVLTLLVIISFNGPGRLELSFPLEGMTDPI